jgi:predicted nuclease of predicted toxin-antitoxin system
MTKILTDENIPSAIIEFLQERGFDVQDVRRMGKSGSSDEEIMEIAQK